MGKLVRRVPEGYITLAEWSESDPATVQAADAVLRREVENGYLAVLEDADGTHPVKQLPADAEVVILTIPMGGG